MRLRDRPLTPPDRLPYFRAVVPSRGEHVFRLPMYLNARAAEQAYLACAIILPDSLLTTEGTAEDLAVAAAAQLTAEQGRQLILYQAALIGLCWCHPVVALEVSPPGSDDALLEYGEAVMEELHEGCDGWPGYLLPGDLEDMAGPVFLAVVRAYLPKAVRRALLASPEVGAAVEHFQEPGGAG